MSNEDLYHRSWSSQKMQLAIDVLEQKRSYWNSLTKKGEKYLVTLKKDKEYGDMLSYEQNSDPWDEVAAEMEEYGYWIE